VSTSPGEWVDTHAHVVADDLAAYPLSPRDISGPWYREAPCSAEKLLALMDEAGVARAVLVQPLGAYSYDNRYAADSAAKHPDRFTSVCAIDPLGADPLGEVERWVGGRGMQGVRLFALSRDASWLADPRLFPVWERAAALGAFLVVTVFAHQLGELRALLARFPEVPVWLDHCGFPALEREPWPEAAPLLALAEFPKLGLKVTTHVLDRAARGGEPCRFVRALVERFGTRRVAWGSDFCQTHDRPYAELVRLGREAFAEAAAAPPARER
jgi:predicted TIM-barrel fold metal-dependent hydrolase